MEARTKCMCVHGIHMKFTLDSSHRDYYLQHRAIEFDALLTPIELKQLKKAVSLSLSERTGFEPEKLSKATPECLFMAGRDLWRTHEALKKIILQRRLAEIAAELTEKKPIRIGFDELFPETGTPDVVSTLKDPYHLLLNKKRLLSEICCLQGILCGLMLCLEGDATPSDEKLSPFSRLSGNGVFLSPDFPIDFKELYERPAHTYLLIVYCQDSALYIYQPDDPHGNILKQMGYSFGDKLKDNLHPVMIR